MTEPLPRVIGSGADYDAMIAAMRARKDEIGLTDEALEALIDLTPRHISKVLGATMPKTMGRFVFDSLFSALAIKFVIVEDPEQLRLMEHRWEKRHRPAIRTQRRVRIGKVTMDRVLPDVCSELGTRGAKAVNDKRTPERRRAIARSGGLTRMARTTPAQRSLSAKLAADARWQRVKAEKAKAVIDG